jgi:hypothetical protein
LECLSHDVILKINEGNIGMIICPEADCKKSLNEIDMKNMNFSKELLEKYENFSVKYAISQMDDMGWCPITGCG